MSPRPEGADDLRARLARLDPVPPTLAVDPSTSRQAHELLERTMLTAPSSTSPDAPSSHPRRTAWVVAAAASVLVVSGAVFGLSGGDAKIPAKAPTSLALTLGASDAMAMCLPFDGAILAGFPVAFAGTVTTVEGSEVTLDVTRWFTGGTADQVVLTATGSAALDGVDFAAGGDYLVTAADGAVSSCGYSGASSDFLLQAFEQAFA